MGKWGGRGGGGKLFQKMNRMKKMNNVKIEEGTGF